MAHLLRSPDMSFNEKENGIKEEFIFSFPLYFELKHSKRYEKNHAQANRTLNYYIKAKIFLFWKNHKVRTSAFMKKRVTKLLLEVFSNWKSYADARAINRYKLSNVQQQKSKETYKDVFYNWKRLSKKMIILRKRYNHEKKRTNRLILRNLFEKWLKDARTLRFERHGTELALNSYQSLLLEKSFQKWQSRFIQHKKVRR